jgi:hypothetical protein
LDHVIEVFKPVAVSIDVEDMRFMEQPVQDGCGGHFIRGEDVDPLFYGPVGSDDGAGSHITGGDKLEKQMV